MLVCQPDNEIHPACAACDIGPVIERGRRGRCGETFHLDCRTTILRVCYPYRPGSGFAVGFIGRDAPAHRDVAAAASRGCDFRRARLPRVGELVTAGVAVIACAFRVLGLYAVVVCVAYFYRLVGIRGILRGADLGVAAAFAGAAVDQVARGALRRVPL